MIISLFLILVSKANGLAPAPVVQNDRHVMFLSRFSGVSGPHFRALFHELVGQSLAGHDQSDAAPPLVNGPRVAYIPTAAYAGTSHDPQLRSAARAEADADAERLTRELGLEHCGVLELDAFDADPLGLKRAVQRLDPHALWVGGGNTFYLRHFMRASGFDSVAQELCGPGPGRPARIYVGASAGAICGGASVATAHFKGWDDPALAPENPLRSPRGLALAGPDLSVFPHFDEGEGHAALIAEKRVEHRLLGQQQEEEEEGGGRVAGGGGEGGGGGSARGGHRIVTLKESQAFVWSQSAAGAGEEGGGMARSFTFNADQFGALEGAWAPPPLSPLALGYEAATGGGGGVGGVTSVGEPPVDPSRIMQRGDSEWFEEASPFGEAQV
jgi:peptidase E